MDVPANILELLKCSRCDKFLSRSPVYLQSDREVLCGQCCTPKDAAIRNIQYEALAQLAAFPCKYRDLGCRKTVPFTQENEPKPHEEVCDYRKWTCPVLGPTCCNWLGHRAEILQHCQDQHPEHVLQNPSTLKHDIVQSNERTYLLIWQQVLFLLHVKVSVTAGKLYYSVRYLGRSDEAKNYIYIVNIKRKSKLLSKKEGEVGTEDSVTSLSIDIDKLHKIPGGYFGVIFIVEVQRKSREIMEVCSGCGPMIVHMVYRDARGLRCERCAPTRRECVYQDCYHRDIDDKCGKHETYFCQQLNRCGVCYKTVERGSLSEHRSSECEVLRQAGAPWRPTRGFCRTCLVSGAAGTAVCECFLTEVGFVLNVFTPVVSERLKEFRCVVRVSQPATGQVHTYTPEIVYDNCFDWHIEVKKEEFLPWDLVLDVSVDISTVDFL